MPRFGPRVLPAAEVLALATINGARALGLQDEIGSIEEGKRADLTVIDLSAPHLSPPGDDLHGALVYSARAADVRDVLVDGRVLVRDRALATLDARALARAAPGETRALAERARSSRGV